MVFFMMMFKIFTANELVNNIVVTILSFYVKNIGHDGEVTSSEKTEAI